MSFQQKLNAAHLAGGRSKTSVTILLATYNGAANIDAQLQSFVDQSHQDWRLIASDDGSTDGTVERLRAFAKANPERRITVLRGPGEGSAANFLSLLRAAGNAPFAAFSDQDDVWLPERLERGVAALARETGPAAHGGRTLITCARLSTKRASLRFDRPKRFRNALVQNVAGGNTMMMNRAALDALQPASLRARGVAAHDWWVYQMVTGMGGALIWDDRPSVLYRQHGANQIGANTSLRSALCRAAALMDGRYARGMDRQIAALAACRELLTPDARAALSQLERLRAGRGLERFRAFRASGVYRQTWQGTLALWVAAAAGRL